MKSLDTFIALNRFGLGAAPGESERVDDDPRGWIKSQINPKQTVPGALAAFPASLDTLTTIHIARLKGPEELRPTTRRLYQSIFVEEVMARAQHMINTKQPFAERMVLFWSNHFTVSRSKGIIGPAIPAYEREAIRPHIFGRFADMLKAASSHSCMLTYLDNQGSAGPNSRAGRGRARRTGNPNTLNENLAREILELHTLGVKGGYTQQDVIELAKAISGWTHGGLRFERSIADIDKDPVRGGFEFRESFHEPGSKTVLGKTYWEAAELEGFRVLDDLARHPSTAKHIATKLVRHFVADKPPAGAVEKIARVFQDTDGDLAAVSAALIELPEVWSEPLPKVKSHYELVIAANRAVGNLDVGRRNILFPLRELGQLPFSAPSPKGWGDRAKNWVSPEALIHRLEWLRRFARQVKTTMYPDQILDDTIGPVAGDDTLTWVSRAPSGDAAIAMILASPEFQRR